MAPANTGNDRRRRSAVRITDHGNRGILSPFCFFLRILRIVVIKFAAPKMELAPARCSEKMAISTDGPLWAMGPDRGG